MMKVIDSLIQSLRAAALCDPNVQAPPACVLWPDHDRQWEPSISRLQRELPELLVLGEYDNETRTGPAIWLRCAIAGKVEGLTINDAEKSIIYLPGISRQDLRAVESCPDLLKPIAELQYRGVIWSQANARDWTILAFLKSSKGGLGLDVAQDNESKNAMQLALHLILDEDIEALRGKHLDKDYFNTLLTGGDPVRDLLQWLDQGVSYKASKQENEWLGFVEVCRSKFAFDPENDGDLAGAEKLARHDGAWKPVWARYCEAPKRYLNIPALIRKTSVPMELLYREGWPQWNEDEENSLRDELLRIGDLIPSEAREVLIKLEAAHNSRRELPWAELGEAPLASALEHLANLAERTRQSAAVGTTTEMVAAYTTGGWLADDAVLRALACIDKSEDTKAVFSAIRSVYLPWSDESARHLQSQVEKGGYPGGSIAADNAPRFKNSGECFIFIDGLRIDIARRLSELLASKGCQAGEQISWAALPSITATGKPAVTPLRDKIRGQDVTVDFEPSIIESGQSLKGGYQLHKLMSDNGCVVLDKTDTGKGSGCAWCEAGNIDHEGHDSGWKISKHIEVALSGISDRILQLLDAGWKSVRVVTDHGWLLMPGGLPKIELPAVLTENKWGRCAIIKTGAVCEERLYPWYWNPDVFFAIADGISCYKKGNEYAHGGLSLQECLTVQLVVTRDAGVSSGATVQITFAGWKGLRCGVEVDGDISGVSVDMRTQPGNPESSVVANTKDLNKSGATSVVVEDEDLEGKKAYLVLLNRDGGLLTQVETVIGGGSE
jgi:hypothetical protein